MSASFYDELPYESLPQYQCHPARIGAVARLFGLPAPRVATARVLELGGAIGANILGIAECHPGMRLVGMDYSERQIERARASARAIGADNISFRCASIADVDESWGEFDYIIAHGVYSWVDGEIRDRLMAVARRNLAPDGIAYVSYNTKPGWCFRSVVRDLMLQYAPAQLPAAQRVVLARAALDHLARAVQGEPYATFIREQQRYLSQRDDHYIAHDHLEPVNHAVYLQEFMAHAAAHGLAYLGEADLRFMCHQTMGGMLTGVDRIPSEADQIATEQFIDFAVNRPLRATLLVHEGRALRRSYDRNVLSELWLASPARGALADPEPASDAPVKVVSRSGAAHEVRDPAFKAALAELEAHWPASLAWADLVRLTHDRLARANAAPTADVGRQIETDLLRMAVTGDHLFLLAAAVPCTRRTSARPRAMATARVAAKNGAKNVCNVYNEVIPVSGDLQRYVLVRLDGQHDIRSLAAGIGAEVPSLAGPDLPARIAAALEAFRDSALLIG